MISRLDNKFISVYNVFIILHSQSYISYPLLTINLTEYFGLVNLSLLDENLFRSLCKEYLPLKYCWQSENFSSTCFFQYITAFTSQKGKSANLDSLDKNKFVFHQLFVYKYISWIIYNSSIQFKWSCYNHYLTKCHIFIN